MRIEFWVHLVTVGFSGYDRNGSRLPDALTNDFSIVALVCNDMLCCFYLVYEPRCSFGIVDFTPSDVKINRISMRVGCHVNLGGSPSPRSANGALFSSPSPTRMLVRSNVTSVGEYPFRINFAS